MREKKFRAWDAEREEFIYSHIPSDDYYFVIEGNHVVAYVRHGETEGVSFPYEPPEPIWDEINEVEQYTERIDRAENKLWEGDIIAMHGDSQRSEIFWDWDGCCWAIWHKDSGRGNIKKELLSNVLDTAIRIGTIHENPELREDKSFL